MLMMLDTDSCSYIIRLQPMEVLQTLQYRVERGDEICISAITYSELLVGAERSGNSQKHLHLIDEFCSRVDFIAPWDAEAARFFSRLQSYLFKQGTPIGNNDTMIAAHAQSLQAIVVTNNQKHFSNVPDLNLENWVKR
jgi:tRNA(fMet)-specific endonuclease VapC